MNRIRRIGSLLAVLVVAVGFVALVGYRSSPSGAGAGPASTPPVIRAAAVAVETAQPATDNQTLDAECKDPIVHLSTFDRASERVANLGRWSTNVVDGVILAIGKAEWNTPDGLPPEQGLATFVVRHATVRVRDATKSKATGDVDVLLPGGTIGCDTYRLASVANIKVGYRVVLFLQATASTDSTESIIAGDAWLVRSDGTVTTPEDGDLSVQELIDLADAP